MPSCPATTEEASGEEIERQHRQHRPVHQIVPVAAFCMIIRPSLPRSELLPHSR